MPLHQIFRSSRIAAICLLVFFLFCGYASAQDKADRTVTITCNPLYAPEFGTCNLGESLTVINGCAETIEVRFNGGTWDVITHPGTKKYGCTDDAHDCYEVRIPGKSGEYATGCSIPYSQEIVPTLSEWGLIIFSLLILNLVTVVIVRRKHSLAIAGDVSGSIKAPLFNAGVFGKMLACTVALSVVGLGIAGAVYGSLAARDIIGTLISAALVAYIVHLWVGPRR